MARARSLSSYSRKGPSKEPYDSVLIVCEGSKTEPRYLSGLRDTHQLSSANIHIMHPDATDPVSIVTYGVGRIAKGEYDKVYCVFDRDGHANYDAALNQVARSEFGRAGRLFAITSWPCFEFWVLLHFQYSAAPFERVQGNSSCDRVLREVKEHMPKYSKGYSTVFADLAPNLETAIRHAKRLAADNGRTGSSNPATRMHELVEYLMGLKGAQ